MTDTDLSPVGRFSPAPGLFIDRTRTAIRITGEMELFGPEATGARAGSIRHTINTTWTAAFPDGHTVACNITVSLRRPGAAARAVAQIEAVRIAGPSHVSRRTRAMTLNANEAEAFTWTAAHEFGHVLGLQDRYSEGIMSKLRSKLGGTRTTTVHPRYRTNLMGVYGGALQSRNVSDLAVENRPSPYWINDDNRVRDWVNHHPIADVARLSAADRLAMIRTLMGGWISDDDVQTIIRICDSVTRRADAQRIRGGVDLNTFSGLGQRMRVRIAFDNMP